MGSDLLLLFSLQPHSILWLSEHRPCTFSHPVHCTIMLSLLNLALIPLALTSLPLISASSTPAAPAPIDFDAEHNSTLSTRTFGWGSHHQSIWDKGGWWSQNQCRDTHKSAICFSRGFGWGCNSQCICIQPPNHDGCKDEGKWQHCQSKGHGWGCGKSCECVPPSPEEPECKSSLVEHCASQGKGASECHCSSANVEKSGEEQADEADKSCQCECRPWVKYFCQKKGGWLSTSFLLIHLSMRGCTQLLRSSDLHHVLMS